VRLLVTGANGQVGWELICSLMPLGEVVGLDRSQCDLSRPERLPALIRHVKPDLIVNAAAYTAVDKAEDEEQLATIVNGTAVGVLAEEARVAGALLVHYSTDYVFDGTEETPYQEEHPPHPINAYGRSKLAGEIAIRQVGSAYIILRTSWVYAARGHNFLRTVLRLAHERDELRMIADQVGAPTWARNIADATAHAIRQANVERAGTSFTSGLFHLTASGATSWHGFAAAILEAAKGNALLPLQQLPKLHPIATEDYPLPAARPKNSRLAGDRLSKRFGIVLPDWREGLARCLCEIGTCPQR
jgi:dTDP-4-dehydrorhamnose reductase